MLDQKILSAQTGIEILGELHAFATQLGNPALLSRLTAAASSLKSDPLDSLPALRCFLETYYTEILLSCDLPTIYRAYSHASRSETRELIASDCQLGHEPVLRFFAWPSQCVGTAQLKRLRPLRGERLVQRYLQAVEDGKAYGWHTVVYGVVLSLYSIPLRQGLINYGQQTMHGFICSATQSLQLLEGATEALHAELCSRLPGAVESILVENLPNMLAGDGSNAPLFPQPTSR